MTYEQAFIFTLLAAAIGLFIWGKWRYDVVAMGVLMAGVVGQVIPADNAFIGFGHPAVITVAAILIISEALRLSGVIDYVADFLGHFDVNPTLQVLLICMTVGVLSAFMNNVGALALMLPVALQYAAKTGRSPSQLLMPLSFGSLLGGLATLIGTPPNIVIAGYREDVTGTSFSMFDFLPVGGVIALVGIAYITIIGWRLLPLRRAQGEDEFAAFAINDYISEVRIPEGSDIIGQPLRALELRAKGDVAIVGLIRGKHTMLAPPGFEMLHAKDVLILEGPPSAIQDLLDATDLAVISGSRPLDAETISSEEVSLMEVVVTPGSRPENMTARALRLTARYNINLLAVARQGRSLMERLGRLRLRAGDVLLLQGEKENLQEAMVNLGCLPLAGGASLTRRKNRSLWPLLIFAVGIGLTALGILPPQIAFMLAVTMMVLVKQLGLRDLYNSIEWPVIVLLGAMIPVGEALSTTGGAGMIAGGIASLGGMLPIWAVMAVLMVITMLLSDVINNTATAVLMAPIAVQIAVGFEVSIDPFLMAVAVASSCTFLTPIGHQSNILVMGPGGYKFSDYWRMGLGLDVIIIAVAIPTILWAWPL